MVIQKKEDITEKVIFFNYSKIEKEKKEKEKEEREKKENLIYSEILKGLGITKT